MSASFYILVLISLILTSVTPILADQTPSCPRERQPSDKLEPGEYFCDDTTAKYVKGLCRYQARRDNERYQQLLAHLTHMQDFFPAGTPSTKNMDPSGSYGQRTIEWWFDQPESNKLFAKRLCEADFNSKIYPGYQILVTLTVYSLEQGYDKEFSYEVGAFYGERQLQERPARGAIDLAKGLFSAFVGIGNPLASFITQGLKISMNKNKISQLKRLTYRCNIGSACNEPRKNTFFVQAGSLGPREKDVGLSFAAIARIDEDDPKKTIELGNLNITYNTLTGEEKNPVYERTFSNGQDLPLEPGKLYMVAAESSDQDVRSGKLIGSTSGAVHTQLFVLLEAQVNAPQDRQDLYPTVSFDNVDRTYSDEERAQLPKELPRGFEGILDSIEPVCFPDQLHLTSEPICGFRFREVDQKYLGHMLKITVSGKLKYGESSVSQLRVGDLYKDKGFYRLPMIDAAGNNTSYALRIELDDSNKVAKKVRSLEKGIKGVSFEFGYYAQKENPIMFNPALKKWIK